MGLPLLLAGCAPAAASKQGRDIYNLYNFFMYFSAVIFVLVMGLVVWSILFHRRKNDELPKQFHGNAKLEFAWTAIPFVIVGILFYATLKTQDRVTSEVANPAVTVDVRAFQWNWEFTYPGTKIDIVGTPGRAPEMVLPLGQEIHFNLTSSDVQHAFYVPKWLFKRDAYPDRTNTFDITPDKLGTFTGACAELCGTNHAYMPFRVRVVPPQEFQSWLQTAASSTQPGT